jgi:hypothetical protein
MSQTTTRRNACAEAAALGLKLYDMQNSHWNIRLQAGLRFWKRVILKCMLKKENSMKFCRLDCKDSWWDQQDWYC